MVAAVNNGCDSVYLGLESFNARMKAPNFTQENLAEWVDYCHLYGVKVYVALNTSVKNDEFSSAVDLLKKIYVSNADGVIVTDLALMALAARLPKPFDVVASTQLNVHDGYGAEFVKKCGATTVVCARESSLDDIEQVVATGINTEFFIHGATCVCQSGQCLFSAMVGGNSGNRGLCAQPCRKLYFADGKKGYFLSARDLCGATVAPLLDKAGVSVYKIEGRNRRAEYAGVTSKVYRELFDNGFRCDETNERDLAEIYNRDMSRLSYLAGGNTEIISPLCQSHAGVAAATVQGKGLRCRVPVCKGDCFKIFDNGSEVCGAVATSSGTEYVTAEFGKAVRDGLEARRTTSVKLNAEILSRRRTLSAKVVFEAQPNEYARVFAECGGAQAEIFSDYKIPSAVNSPSTQSEIAEQLRKSGDSCFTICDIDIKIGKIFLAKSQINALRRQVLNELKRAVVRRYNERFTCRRNANLSVVEPSAPASKGGEPMVAVICKTEQELEKAKEFAQLLIYKPSELSEKEFRTAARYKAYVDLPSFYRSQYVRDLFEKFRPSVVCHNVGQVELARVFGSKYVAGSGLNIYNDWIAEQFSDAETFVYSQELTVAETSRFARRDGLIFVDGSITLMKLVHCPYKLLYGETSGRAFRCGDCEKVPPIRYRDEQGNEFAIVRRKGQTCTFELTNGKKLSAAGRLKRPGRYLIDCDEAVARHYANINAGTDDGYVERAPYTKGRLFDKVN